jgi:hypothetical protein
MLRFFRGPARLIEIPVGCASPQALHTAKTSYLGTMVPCRDTLPALPLCFSRSEMSRSIVYLLPIVDDCLHLIGLRDQTAVVTIQTIGPSHDHQPTAWQVRARVAQLAQSSPNFGNSGLMPKTLRSVTLGKQSLTGFSCHTSSK